MSSPTQPEPASFPTDTLPAGSPAEAGLPRVSVPGYEVLEVLGRGGMGVVYKARQVSANRVVALKMVLAGSHAGAEEMARFRKEAQAIASLEHLHVVRVYEVGEHQGLPFFSLEFCEGGSLDRRLQGKPVSPRVAAALVAALARGVQAAHDHGILHRDLKPGNVLLSAACGLAGQPEQGPAKPQAAEQALAGAVPKITDFGLAKRLDDVSGLTRTGNLLGTPAYMAPEQARGEKALGPAVDVYALGAILYECLTGRPPFQGPTSFETVMQVLGKEPVAPSHLQPSVPRDLETVCLKCLHKDPRRRYASALALADDLGNFLANRPVSARPVGALERGWRWCRRNPLPALLGAAVAASLVVGAVVALFFAARAEQAAALARAQAGRAEIEARRATEQAGAAEQARQGEARRANAERRARALAQEAQKREEEARGHADRARAGAQAEKRRAEGQLLRSEWLVYAMQVDRAYREWQEGDAGRAGAALDACRFDFRGWEWRYLRSLLVEGQQVYRNSHRGVVSLALMPDGRPAAGNRDGVLSIWRIEPRLQRHDLVATPGYEIGAVCSSPDGRAVCFGLFKGPRFLGVYDLVRQRGDFLVGHTASVTGVRFFPDGRRLASASADRTVKLWRRAAPDDGDVLRWKLVRTLEGHTAGIRGLDVSRDGRRLATASADGTVRVWDPATGKLLHNLPGPGGQMVGVSFHPGGHLLAAAGLDMVIQVWDLRTAREVQRLRGHRQWIPSVCYSPDGKLLASGSGDQTVKVWDAGSGKLLHTLKGHTGEVWAVCFGKDGRSLVSAALDQSVRVWDLERLRDSGREFWGHGAEVLGVAFSRDGRLLATASADRTVRLWDPATRRRKGTLEGHEGPVRGVSFSPDGKLLASGDRTVRLWDLATLEQVRSLSAGAEVGSVCFHPAGQLLAAACWDGKVRLWRADSGALVQALQAGPGGPAFLCCSFSPDGRLLAAGDVAGRVLVWETATGKRKLALAAHRQGVVGIAFSPEGGRLASASEDRTIRLWDLGTGRTVRTLTGHTQGVVSVCFHPEGRRLASKETFQLKGHANWVFAVCFSADGRMLASTGGGNNRAEIKLWDVRRAWDEPAIFRGHAGLVVAGCYSPDGKLLASGEDQGLGGRQLGADVKVWEASTGREVAAFSLPPRSVLQALCFSPDGSRLAGLLNGFREPDAKAPTSWVVLWDPMTGQARRSFPVSGTPSWPALAFRRDGRLLAVGRLDGSIGLWDPHTGKRQATLGGKRRDRRAAVRDVNFSPDGSQLASASMDGTVRLWDVHAGRSVRLPLAARVPFAAVRFSGDGKRLAAVTLRGRICFWDVESRALVDTVHQIGTMPAPSSLSFSRDGRLLASGGFDEVVYLWDTERFTLRGFLTGHAGPIHWVTFSPDGETVASGSDDQTVRLWSWRKRTIWPVHPLPDLGEDAVQATPGL
jgi:WD40 repeat protein